jgi:hypothetical protein
MTVYILPIAKMRDGWGTRFVVVVLRRNKDNSRSPPGMTTRKARTKATRKIRTKATATGTTTAKALQVLVRRRCPSRRRFCELVFILG